MRVGIIGSGMIGGSLAALFAERGHEVLLANSRGPQSLTETARQLGMTVTPATIVDTARGSDVVFVAIPFGRYKELPVDAFAGRIVVDTTNYYPQRDGAVPELDSGDVTSSELLARHLGDAQVVKAFNTLYFEQLRTAGRPDAPPSQRLAIPLAGDNARAKALVTNLIENIGFAAVDAGNLAAGRHQQPGQPVYNMPVGPAEATKLLEQR
ncbi:MAG: NAD(P)-binding domain-containing protein [Pseudonocardiaceae bacterium]